MVQYGLCGTWEDTGGSEWKALEKKNFNSNLVVQALSNDLLLPARCSVVSHIVFAAIRQF